MQHHCDTVEGAIAVAAGRMGLGPPACSFETGFAVKVVNPVSLVSLATGLELLNQVNHSSFSPSRGFPISYWQQRLEESRNRFPVGFRWDCLIQVLHYFGNRRLCLVHGDPHWGNFVREGERLFLVDWEFAFFGDPLWDVIYFAKSLGVSPCDLPTAFTGQSGFKELWALSSLITHLWAEKYDVRWQSSWGQLRMECKWAGLYCDDYKS